MPTYGGDEVSAVVLDIGTSTTRAGYAGEDAPKCLIPTSYGYVPAAAAGAEPSYLFGDHGPTAFRPGQSVLSPMRDGIVHDWAAAEKLVHSVFERGMRLGKVKEVSGDAEGAGGGVLGDHPLLVTEACWNPKENRERMMELAFEGLGVPAYYSVDRAVANAFASGKGSALIVDVGEESTTVTPVCDGFVLRKALQKCGLSGSLLSKLLAASLRGDMSLASGSAHDLLTPQYLVATRAADGCEPVIREDRRARVDPSFHRYAEDRVLHELKESVLEVYPRTWDENALGSAPAKQFDFPLGITKSFGRHRFAIPESLFNPAFIPQGLLNAPPPPSSVHPGSTYPTPPLSASGSLPRAVFDSVMGCDADLQPTLLSNIVVTGGTSLIPGFVERLDFEIRSVATGAKVKVQAAGNVVERRFGAWLGGSILASLGTFHQLWIGREEYMEQGRSVVHRRCK